MTDTNNDTKKTGGVNSRTSLYSVVSAHTKEAIATLVDLMKNSRNDNVKLGAAKALLDKALPDIKAVELTGLEGEQLSMTIKIVDEKLNPIVNV